MSIEIKRIYLENYKLFTLKELTFSNNLCVFDGPNGYGKTSIVLSSFINDLTTLINTI